ncbi:MAG: aminopeptidase P family protein [Chitinophagaceae bacterium]|nr:MAG: aminopeptidase P family protein [Chitinophagaceae bacterium]
MKKVSILLIAISLFTYGSVSAQTMWKYFTADDFAARRAKVMNEIGDAVLVMQAAELPEGYVKFRQDNNFYYLTGVEIPDAVLLLDGKTKQSILMVPDNIPNDIKEEAFIKAGKAAADEYKFTRVISKNAMTNYLQYIADEGRTFYLMQSPQETTEMSRDRCLMTRSGRINNPWDGRISKELTFINKIRERFPANTIKDITPVLDKMRWVKDKKEIAVLRECGRIGCLGINEAIKVTRPGIYEYQTVAACDFIYGDMGTNGPAYYAIAASGERGLIWHYNANNHLLESGNVLLIDYAPEVNYYVTDITRTWPVKGEFTDEQLKFYNCVKEARDEIIKSMKPGTTYKSMQEVGAAVYKKHGFEKYWIGYVGHFVGMAVHDVGSYETPFVEGVVFNVEPILEDKDKKIHIRLEDTIVITASGSENLTPQSPVDPKAIYALMKEKGIGER